MIALLGSLVVVLLIVLLVVAIAVGLSVVPFVVAVDMAERRTFSTWRCGAVQLVALLLALGVGDLGRSHPLLLLVSAALCWLVPGVLSIMTPTEAHLGGVQGAHEA